MTARGGGTGTARRNSAYFGAQHKSRYAQLRIAGSTPLPGFVNVPVPCRRLLLRVRIARCDAHARLPPERAITVQTQRKLTRHVRGGGPLREAAEETLVGRLRGRDAPVLRTRRRNDHGVCHGPGQLQRPAAAYGREHGYADQSAANDSSGA